MIPLNTQLKTRNGSQAFVFQTFQDSNGTTNYFGAYLADAGYWAPAKWRADGKFYGNVIHGKHGNDLMIPKRKFWVVWPSDFARPSSFTDECAARKFAEFHEFPFAEYEEP
jgi:hypothetical protein